MYIKKWNSWDVVTHGWPIHRYQLFERAIKLHNKLIEDLNTLEMQIQSLELTTEDYTSTTLDLFILTETTPPCSLSERVLSLEKRINSISQLLQLSFLPGKPEPQSNESCPTFQRTNESSSSTDTFQGNSSSTLVPRMRTTETHELEMMVSTSGPTSETPTNQPSNGTDCYVCNGQGEIGPNQPCPRCKGQGTNLGEIPPLREVCSRCHGLGQLSNNAICSFCGGAGSYDAAG